MSTTRLIINGSNPLMLYYDSQATSFVYLLQANNLRMRAIIPVLDLNDRVGSWQSFCCPLLLPPAKAVSHVRTVVTARLCVSPCAAELRVVSSATSCG